MKKNSRFKLPRLRLGRLLLPFIVLVVGGLVAVTALDQQGRLDQLAKEETALQQTLDELDTEKARLERMIDYAGTDAYIEQIARDVLGWVKHGETKYVMPEATEDSGAVTDLLPDGDDN